MSMFPFGQDIFDSYSYSRPVSYRSYTPRVWKPYILTDHLDKESDEIKGILQRNRQGFDEKETLARGITWNGYLFGKRRFNHNSADSEYYIHQWKPTNDLSAEHPTGTRAIYHNFGDFARGVEKLVTTPANLL